MEKVVDEFANLNINEEIEKQRKKEEMELMQEFDGLKAKENSVNFSGKKRERSMSINYNTLEEFMKEENKKIKTTAKKKNKNPNMQFKHRKERYSSID